MWLGLSGTGYIKDRPYPLTFTDARWARGDQRNPCWGHPSESVVELLHKL